MPNSDSPIYALGTRLVDYAGLFPPASLEMGHMVENFMSYLQGPSADFLGRCIVPAARLEQFEQALSSKPASNQHGWRLSLIASGKPESDWASINGFNLRQQQARIISVEAKAASAEEIRALSAAFPPGLELWIEIPVARDPSPLLAAVADAGRGAKIRTGGVTPDAFPLARDVARFLIGCHRAGVVAKATAGLHHPLSAAHPLTYEPAAPVAPMFGFLNMFLAAALARTEATPEVLTTLLLDGDPTHFRRTLECIAWCEHGFTSSDLAHMRKHLLRSFGSCSFTEPIEGLHALGWL